MATPTIDDLLERFNGWLGSLSGEEGRAAAATLMEWEADSLRSLPYRLYLRTSHWRKLRELALDRAGHACQLCPATWGLQVHHRTYARLGCERLSDLTVLCGNCHRRHHGK